MNECLIIYAIDQCDDTDYNQFSVIINNGFTRLDIIEFWTQFNEFCYILNGPAGD